MAVHVNLSDTVKNSCNEDQPRIHLMPCKIKSNDSANVSKYFEPLVSENTGGVFSVSFRGYPLLGKEINLPVGYTGVILQEQNEKLSEETDRNVYVSHTFSKFMYWNWDKVPSNNDNILSALDWINISQVLHSAVS